MEGGGTALAVGIWTVQAVLAAVIGLGVTAILRWVRHVNARLARIESHLDIRGHRK